MRNTEKKTGISRLANRGMSPSQRKRIQNFRNSYVVNINTNQLEASKDTIERMEIHKRIKELVNEEKDKSEIVQVLINEFPSSSLKNFFDTYAQHHLDKMKKSDSKKEGKEEI